MDLVIAKSCKVLGMQIYTKTGDKGKTSLLGGERFSKAEIIFELLGTLDELNASLSFVSNTRIKDLALLVNLVQNQLFEIGALLANPQSTSKDYVWLEKEVKGFEKSIDKISKKLPKLTNFILPGGSQDSCHLHLCRAICRRLERLAVLYFDKFPKDSDKFSLLVQYLNRLSDLLFVMGRYSNLKLHIKDVLWKRNLLIQPK